MAKRIEDVTGVRVFRLKVTLRHIHPPLWRRLLVRDDASLAELHECLQLVMGWSDSHGHEFDTKSEVYAPKEYDEFLSAKDERRARLCDVLHHPKQWMFYMYDFGDGWVHEVRLERIEPFVPDHPYPWVVAGRRACPPEDIGGVGGYGEFLDVISNPNDPEYEEMLEWHGGPFDPEAFDLEALNRLMHGGR